MLLGGIIYRMSPLRALVCAVVTVTLVWAAGCSDKAPEDPGLVTDDLGLGLTLGMDVTAAREAAGRGGSNTRIEVLTRDALNRQNPYADGAGVEALVLAVYIPYPDSGEPLPGVAYQQITEIRCYLPGAADTAIELLGEPVSILTPESLVVLLGAAADRSTDASGDTHLTFRFAVPKDESPTGSSSRVELVTSHSPDGGCWALRLALTPAE